MKDGYRVIGKCYACRQPVRRALAAWVIDRSVTIYGGRHTQRLAHAGDCQRELEYRVGGWGR